LRLYASRRLFISYTACQPGSQNKQYMFINLSVSLQSYFYKAYHHTYILSMR